MMAKNYLDTRKNSGRISSLLRAYSSLIFLFLITSATALAASPVPIPKNKPSPCVAGSDPFANIRKNLKNPDHACNANLNAKLEEEKGFPCQKIWATIGDKIKEYEAKKQKNCAIISSLDNTGGAAACGMDANQKQCLLRLAAMMDKAAAAEEELAKDLTSAKEEVDGLVAKAQEAQQKYSDDQRVIAMAMVQADKKIADLKSESMVASKVGDQVMASELRVLANAETAKKQNASGISGFELQDAPVGQVTSTTGAADTLNQYSSKIPTLSDEQKQAASFGKNFKEAASDTISRHTSGATGWRASANDLRSKANVGLDTAKDPADTGGSKSNVTGGSRMASTNTAGTGAIPASGDEPTGSGAPSGSGGGAPQIPSMGGGGSGSGSGSQGDISQPDYAGFESDSSSASNSAKTGTANDIANKKSKSPKGGAENPEFAGVPDSSKPGSDLGGGYAGTGTSASPDKKSSALAKDGQMPAARGVDGGGSAGANSSGGSRSPASDKKNGQKLNDFETNLNAGGVGIAGSEIASTVDDLSSEFGLDAGGLTDEEKAAFASLEGNKDGEEGSIVNASIDGVGDREGQALFFRTKDAHKRALKRGNLMITVKSRL